MMLTVMLYGAGVWLVIAAACCVDWKATWRNAIGKDQ
jgi:hypothetical protein